MYTHIICIEDNIIDNSALRIHSRIVVYMHDMPIYS